MDPKKPGMTEAQIDAIVDAVGLAEGGEQLLAEMLKAESDAGAERAPQATSAKEIRARVKELAAKNPELIVRIINYWIKEDRNKKR